MAVSHGHRFVPAFFFLVAVAAAAEPELKHLYPVAAGRGTSTAVVISGKLDPWPPGVWVDSPGISFTPTPMTGTFNVDVDANAAEGAHLVRLFNEDGASAPRAFIVSHEADLRDQEPNDQFKAPQVLPVLPATVSGKLDKSGDVDCFSFALKAGETLVAWLDATILASTFDGVLRLVDTAGNELAFNHDGFAGDPFITWKAPHDGTFVLQVMGFAYPANSEVRFTGGEGCVYRLHLTAAPLVRFTLPLAVRRGEKTALQLIGWNLKSYSAEFDGTDLPPSTTSVELRLAGLATKQPIPVSDIPELMEREPNNTKEQAQQVELPVGINGRIQAAGDEDRFAFHALKDHSYELKLTAARHGSPMDGWLKIENKDLKEVARNDDAAGSRDPQLSWTAPADGDFVVAVGDLTHRGGDDYVYRFTMAEPVPTVVATVAAHSLKLQAGKDGELKLTVKRTGGFKAPVQIAAMDLPAQVTAAAVPVPDKDGEVTIKLVAGADAQVSSQPFRVVLRETESQIEHSVNFPLTSSSEDNGVPQGFSELLIPSTDRLWLTVVPAPPSAAAPK